MRHHGAHNWPPVWRQSTAKDAKFIMGEIGNLAYVHCRDGPSTKCFLVIEHEGESYVGALLFDDAPFCHHITNLLRQHIGHSIEEIGDLDLSHMLLGETNFPAPVPKLFVFQLADSIHVVGAVSGPQQMNFETEHSGISLLQVYPQSLFDCGIRIS